MNLRGKHFFKYVFLMAGLVILAHAVIPHHHFNRDCLLSNHTNSGHLHDHHHSDDFKCLITNKLFVEKSPHFKIKKQQQVNLLLFAPENERQKTFIFSASEFIHTDFRCSNSPVFLLTESPLRAPPATLV